MYKKYELTDETIFVNGHILHKIRALMTFIGINEGSFGGYIESEDNLSHIGRCWVYSSAMVYEHARIFGNAYVYGNASVYGNATIFGRAKVFERAKIYGNAYVYGDACVYGEIILNSGNWNKKVEKRNACYIVSSTLSSVVLWSTE